MLFYLHFLIVTATNSQDLVHNKSKVVAKTPDQYWLAANELPFLPNGQTSYLLRRCVGRNLSPAAYKISHEIQSVCKHWRSLISNHQFCHLHTLCHADPQPSLILPTHTSSHTTFILVHTSVTESSHLVVQNTEPQNLEFLQWAAALAIWSFRGLLCLYTTKQSRKISITERDVYTDVKGLTLAIDPLKSPHYKIVCVRAARNFSSGHERHCRLKIYDSHESRMVSTFGAIYNSHSSKLLFRSTLMLKFHGIRTGELQLHIASSKSQTTVSTISS